MGDIRNPADIPGHAAIPGAHHARYTDMEALAAAQAGLDYGLSFQAVVTTATDSTHFKASGLTGKGNDYFNGYYAYVVWDAGGSGAAPQGEIQPVSDYVSSDGTFTHAAFTQVLATTDEVLVLHPALAHMAGVAVPQPPIGASLFDILHKDGSYTFDNASDSLEAIADAIGAIPTTTGLRSTAAKREAGAAQIAVTTIDLNQTAATYDLFTGTAQAVTIESLVIKMPTGAAGGSLTSIAIQTDDATVAVIFNSTDGDVSNLTSEAQLAWTGLIYLKVGQKVQLTIGGGAHGSTYTCNVVAKVRAVVDGGNLA